MWHVPPTATNEPTAATRHLLTFATTLAFTSRVYPIAEYGVGGAPKHTIQCNRVGRFR